MDSYGAPAAGVINPRTPAQSNRRVSVVRPQTPPVHSQPIPLNPGYKVGSGFKLELQRNHRQSFHNHGEGPY